MENQFDLIVIGGGPAGYVASIRAAQLGMRVACVEKRNALGGTCLNIGCIPSKTLLDSSEHYLLARTKFSRHGIMIDEVRLDLGMMMKRKESVVRQLVGGVSLLFKKNKVEWVQGSGRLHSVDGETKEVEVETSAGKRILSAPKILLATGSEPVQLPFMPFDGKRVISSTEALSLTAVPRHLVVVGGGVIGLELGSVWLRLGAKVTVVEFLDHIAGATDKQLATELKKSLMKQGMEFHLSSKCLGGREEGQAFIVDVEDMAAGNRFSLECDVVLVATGRRPYLAGLGLKEAGIRLDKTNRVEIDRHFETNIRGVFAIGDLVPGPMLAHKAEEEGIAAVEMMAGKLGHVNYDAIPGVIYTAPEVASVGMTEEEARAKGVNISVGVFPFLANGRAKAMDDMEGFVKVIADTNIDRIIGLHIIGPRASDLIAEGALAVQLGATSDQLARTCHAHPTLPETIKEAALAVRKRAIHI